MFESNPLSFSSFLRFFKEFLNNFIGKADEFFLQEGNIVLNLFSFFFHIEN
jgi:hypothetical protein